MNNVPKASLRETMNNEKLKNKSEKCAEGIPAGEINLNFFMTEGNEI
jgi:hypothetical protein